MKCMLLLLSLAVGVYTAGLNEEFTWTRINFVWPQESRFAKYSRPSKGHSGGGSLTGGSDFAFPGSVNNNRPTTTAATTSLGAGNGNDNNAQETEYIYQNNVPMGTNRWGDKVFITIPRRRLGVPSTLNYVSMSSTERHNVPLTSYPNWETNQLSTPVDQRLVSVYRVAVDECDRLWMIDTGILELPGNRTILQPHSIVIMDLKTDKIIHRYTLKASDVTPATVLHLITVDVPSTTCDNAYAYLPDLAGYGLVVYSLKDNNSWRVAHNYFYLEPTAGDFNIGGQVFQWNDGIFSGALSAEKKDGFRDMYFQSMAGVNLYVISTRVLRNQTLATRSNHGNDFVNLGDRGALTQTSATDLHKPSGVLFFNFVNKNALGCWNTNKPFSQDNIDIVQRNDDKMIYPCDLKIYKDDVIVLTNNMPQFLYSQLNYDEINFRVWMNSVKGAVSATKCEMKRKQGGGRPGYGK